VVIKQNTGGGKTVIGLLIAQSTLNEGVGKAVYLAPDTYLAGRVRQEAAALVNTPAVGDSTKERARDLMHGYCPGTVGGLDVCPVEHIYET
jgi:replicative superfamily II helicase